MNSRLPPYDLLYSLRHFISLPLLVALLFGTSRCAKQVTPGGGPRDDAPPKAVRIDPANFSTNLTARQVTIVFDEFIELRDVQTQVFMSPAASQRPAVRLRNKTVIVTLPDTLEANTTYTVFFGNSIRDLNEGNVLANFQYVFSTGPFIDSLRLLGFVYNSIDNKPYNNALVMLRRDASDSAIVTQRPDYFTRTDANGFFRMDYLRGGEYRLTALDDVNSNFRYEPSEAIAFSDSIIVVKDTSQTVALRMFKAEPERNRVVSARHTPLTGRITVALAKAVETLEASLLEPVIAPLPYTYNLFRDTVVLFAPPLTGDTMLLRLRQTGMDTTFRMRIVPLTARDTLRRRQAAGGEPVPNLARTSRDVILPFGQSLRIAFPVPFVTFDSTKALLTTATDTLTPLPFTHSIGVDTFFHRPVLDVQYPFRQDSSYRFRLLDSATQDAMRVYGRARDYTFRYGTPDDVGNLIARVQSLDSTQQYILVLRSTVLGFERTWIIANTTSTEITARNLVPGLYTLHLIRDDNRNRRRDSGNYWEGRQPERTFTHHGGVTIRANWDLDITMQATGDGSGGKGLKGTP